MANRVSVPTTWTTQQILALAPDTSSAKSGQDLAITRKWVTLGHSDQAAWGECQGSGSKPYQTQIDLTEPAFKCSCPSRKFPCKHGLGLFLLLAKEPTAVTVGEPPDWVAQWLAGRTDKAEQKTQKAEQKTAVAADPAAQAKRQAQREAKISAGLGELKLWLHDLVRQGLADLPSRPKTFWETPAARLVDAQAPGAARLLRDLSGVPSEGTGWQERLLFGLSKLHLLVEGWERRQSLPAPALADVRTTLGWALSQEDVLAEPGLRDVWTVVGQRIEDEDRLRAQRTWLLGESSGRSALILNFAHGTQPLDTSLVPGTTLDAELAFFPSAQPTRALVKTRHGEPRPPERIPGAGSIAGAYAQWAAALAANPWIERGPIALQSVVPVYQNGTWAVRDGENRRLPLTANFDRGWHLLAVSGGQPLDLFGEWDGDRLRPLGAWAEGRFVTT